MTLTQYFEIFWESVLNSKSMLDGSSGNVNRQWLKIGDRSVLGSAQLREGGHPLENVGKL